MIQDIKDLKALFKLCRAQGITEFKMNGIEIKFGDLPTGPIQEEQVLNPANRFDNFPQGELTPEQLMFYSSGGDPKDDPELNKASSQ